MTFDQLLFIQQADIPAELFLLTPAGMVVFSLGSLKGEFLAVVQEAHFCMVLRPAEKLVIVLDGHGGLTNRFEFLFEHHETLLHTCLVVFLLCVLSENTSLTLGMLNLH